MMTKESVRAQIRARAYTAGYAECVGPRGRKHVHQRAQQFMYRMLGTHPQGWMVGLVLAAYQDGWRDKAAGKPCQPFPPGV